MQTIDTIYTGQVPGYISWSATTDNPTRGKTETSGDARGSMEFTIPWVISKVAREFGITPEDTIYVNGELYQESSITIAERADAEAAEAERQRLAQEAAEKAEQEAEKQRLAAKKGVTDPELSQGVTSPPQTQGVNDNTGLMSIINTLISQKAQVQDTGDADIKEFEKQISDLKNQITQAQEANETAKMEELDKKIEELNAQKAQAQAAKETDIKELERQIAEVKKSEQPGFSQFPMKIIAAVGGAILIVILLIAVILRGKK